MFLQALCDMVEDFNKASYKTVFWKVKPSVLRVMQGIVDNDVHRQSFIHCRTEYEMESLVDCKDLFYLRLPLILPTYCSFYLHFCIDNLIFIPSFMFYFIYV